MTKSIENVKPIGKLLEAVHDVVKRDLALKLYAPEDLRLTIAKRKEVTQAYIASGMSQREAAQALGVDQSTIRRDLGKNLASKRRGDEDKNTSKSKPSASNRRDENRDGQGQQKKDWRVEETRRLLGEAKKLALDAHKKYGHPAQEHLDPNILRQAVDEPDKLVTTLRLGGQALNTLADEVEGALTTPFALPPPMFDDTPGNATPDQTT